MTHEEIESWCYNEMRAPIDSDMYRRGKAILALVRLAAAPPWLGDAAEALGEVRKFDGAPLAMTWAQTLEAIRELREERDEWQLRAEQSEYHHECCRARSHDEETP